MYLLHHGVDLTVGSRPSIQVRFGSVGSARLKLATQCVISFVGGSVDHLYQQKGA